MIIILEGAERSGKTTLAKALENRGFVYFKDVIHANDGSLKTISSSEMINRIDGIVNFIRAMDSNNVNVVIDRLHITEKVRKPEVFTAYRFFDSILSLLNCKLVLMEREITPEYEKQYSLLETKYNLEKVKSRFSYFCSKSEIKEKFTFDLSKIEVNKAADILIASSEEITPIEYDFYLASPFFNAEQKERMYYVLNTLRTNGYNVYAPIEMGIVSADESEDFVSHVFNSNVEAICNSRKVLAITDGKDMGTIWEAGFAYGIGKPVIYFAETLGNNPFNIMLSESGVGIYTDRDELYKAAQEHSFNNKSEVKHE